MRAIFFGTPEIAVPSLEALTAVAEVAAVVCQPDRPAGRGLQLHAPAVKVAAIRLGLAGTPAEQSANPRVCRLGARTAGRFRAGARRPANLPPAVLSAPEHGCLNLHASILPRYRGAAPLNWCIVKGETTTGVSLMQMDEGLDTGPVYAVRRIAIGVDETAGQLAERMAQLAADVVREDVPRWCTANSPRTRKMGARQRSRHRCKKLTERSTGVSRRARFMIMCGG